MAERCFLYVEDENGEFVAWDGLANIDGESEVEIIGTSVLNRRYAPALSGDNILVAVAAGTRMRLKKAFLSVGSDITGEIILKLGSNSLCGILNPLKGQYLLVSPGDDYEIGADGADLIANLPGASADVRINATYDLDG